MHGPSCRPRQNGPNRGMEEEEEVEDEEEWWQTRCLDTNICLNFLEEEGDDTFHFQFWSGFEEHDERCLQISAGQNLKLPSYHSLVMPNNHVYSYHGHPYDKGLIISLQPWSMTIAMHWSVCWEHGYDAMQCIEVPCRIANSWASRGGF